MEVVKFDLNNLYLANTMHHYCGFYSNFILPQLIGNFVTIDNRNYTLEPKTIICSAYNGRDTIITEMSYLITDKINKVGSYIYNNGNLVGLVTRNNIDKIIPIQNGFNNINIHLSNIQLEHRVKTKLIAYADQQFDNKQQLLEYLENNVNNNHQPKAIIYTDCNNNNAQLIVYENGLNIINTHLRNKYVSIN
uniref:Acetyltransferase-like protein n=1 Tax=Spodoptera litura male-killing virus TaxID=2996810 RepID=A0AA86IVU2_9VIRU|nr:acetyltransferase-like protein [Spodoptera litura male-killing virus]